MDELRWWRRRRPQALKRADIDQLHARLIALTPTSADDARRTLLREAAGESGTASFRIGLLLLWDDPTTTVMRDLAASWLYLCVHGPAMFRHRQDDARLILREMHLRDVNRLRRLHRGDPGAFVAAGRQMVIAQEYVHRPPSWVVLYRDDLRAAQEAGSAGPAPEAAAAPLASDTPRQRVILADELPGPYRHDERRMVESYKALLGEMPLAGDPTALPMLADQLESTFPWLTPFIDHLRDEVALRLYAGAAWFHLRPVLLAGPPGCGKTLIARRLADLAGVGSDMLALGGASDARHLHGTARGWASAQPCGPLVAMQRHGCANPVLILDELEKCGGSDHAGRVHETLLSMLEPVSAQRYFDEALNVQIDISAVTWIATANTVEPLPPVLRSRLTVIAVPAPDGDQLDGILEQIASDVARDLGVRRDALPPLDPGSRDALRADLDRHGDVRRIARGYRRAIAAAVRGRARPVDA